VLLYQIYCCNSLFSNKLTWVAYFDSYILAFVLRGLKILAKVTVWGSLFIFLSVCTECKI